MCCIENLKVLIVNYLSSNKCCVCSISYIYLFIVFCVLSNITAIFVIKIARDFSSRTLSI